MQEVFPIHAPMPRALLGWDGTDYRVVLVDTAGRVRVRGEDQLFSYKDSVVDKSSGAPSGANGYRVSSDVPAGTVWVITQMCAYDLTTATTIHGYRISRGGVDYDIYEPRVAFAATQRSNISCQLYLVAGDHITVFFVGALAGDTCVVILHGYSMTKEV